MMARILLLLWFNALFATGLFAGTIHGNVKAQARPEAMADIEAGKYEDRKHKFLERLNYDSLKDFVVYIDQPMKGARPSTKSLQIVIQKDATFWPHVLPVVVGTTVEWPNHDDIYHNVFSMSDAKPFDLGFYRTNEVKRVTFDKPGRVDIFCSIHTKMSCIVLVLENPYFAVTDKNGNYKISNLPAGTYRVKAWHERLPPQLNSVTLSERGDAATNFVLSVTGLPRY
jgi:plastocyanin